MTVSHTPSDALHTREGYGATSHGRCLLATLLATILLTTVVGGPASSDVVSARSEPEITSRANELQPAASSEVIAWSRDDRRPGLRIDAFARYKGRRVRLNKRGTHGLMGGVDGTNVAYVEFTRRRSHIRLFDVHAQNRLALAPGANTAAFEEKPTLSGQWVLFGRTSARSPFPFRVPGRSSVVLFNRITGEERILQRTTRPRIVTPGQINGHWATWNRCGTRVGCEVYRYDLRDAARVKVAVGRSAKYAASVDASGNVFFTRSAYACGRRVEIVRAGIDGSREVIARLPRGYDLFRTFAHADRHGDVRVLYDRLRCRNFRFDIYSTSTPAEDPPDTGEPVRTGVAVTHHVNELHNGSDNDPSFTVPLERRWSIQTGGVLSYPLVVEGKVFVTNFFRDTTTTSLYALDASDGSSLWTRRIGSSSWSAPAYDAGRVFVADGNGTVQAFDSFTGALVWKRDVGTSSEAAPVARDGRVYVVMDSGLHVLSQETGKVLWVRSGPGVGGSPALVGRTLYVADQCGNSAAFDRFEGELLWRTVRTGCSGPGGQTVSYYDGLVYARAGDAGSIFDANDGRFVGDFPSISAPAFAGEQAFYRVGTQLEARDAETGALSWTFDPTAEIRSEPIVINDVVYVGTNTGSLYGLDVLTGSIVWTYDGTGIFEVPPPSDGVATMPTSGIAVGEGLLVVPGRRVISGTLTALEPTDDL